MTLAVPHRLPETLPDRGQEPAVADEDALAPLARAAANGDAAGQRALCERLAPTLLAVQRALHGASSPDLGDLLQESLVAVLRALPEFRGESSVTHFARRIAVRRGLDFRRRVRTMASVAEAVAHEPSREAALPPDEVCASRLRVALWQLLDELPEEQAETLAMRVVLGNSVAEIAQETRVPINTVRSRLLAAKSALRSRILADPTLRELAGAEP